MRFCMVTTFYPPFHTGGDAVYVEALAHGLQRAGHAVEVVHCEDAFHLAGVPQAPTGPHADDGVVVHRLKHPLGVLSPLITQQTGRPGLKRRALEAVLDRDFDVIHFHNISLVGGPGVLELGRARVKLYSLHEHWLLCPTHVFWKNREKACDSPTCWTCCVRSGIPIQLWRSGDLVARELEHVDLLLAPSKFTARKHREAGITRPIEVMPLFSRLAPAAAGLARRPTRPHFVFVGRVTASKGARVLAELFATLPEYALTVVGEGDLRANLQTAFAGASNICFSGTLAAAELSELYASCTASVIPSLAPESLSLVALESFAHALPVIAFDAGGCGEVVRAAGGGWVCRDIASMRAAIHAAATDRDAAEARGRAGRRAYEEHYTQERHLEGYVARVRELLAAPPRRSR